MSVCRAVWASARTALRPRLLGSALHPQAPPSLLRPRLQPAAHNPQPQPRHRLGPAAHQLLVARSKTSRSTDGHAGLLRRVEHEGEFSPGPLGTRSHRIVDKLDEYVKEQLRTATPIPVQRDMSELFVQIAGTGTPDLGPSVIIFTTSTRILINCSEGMQRFCSENRLMDSKLNTVLLTQSKWATMAGLPGLVLTRFTSHSKAIRIMGPRAAKRILDASNEMFFSKPKHEYIPIIKQHDSVWNTSSFSFTPVHLGVETADDGATSAVGDDAAAAASVGQEHKRRRLAQDGKEKDEVVCYVLHVLAPLGKFDAKRAKELGVPFGPLCGLLKNGESVTLKDGTVVRPEEVVAKKAPSQLAFVVECPSLEYVDELVHHPRLSGDPGALPYSDTEAHPRLIVHMAPATVLADPRYRAWAAKFNQHTRHVALHGDFATPAPLLQRPFASSVLLHDLDAEIFPKLFASDALPPAVVAEQEAAAAAGTEPLFSFPSSLTKYHFLPARLRNTVDTSACCSHAALLHDSEAALTAARRQLPAAPPPVMDTASDTSGCGPGDEAALAAAGAAAAAPTPAPSAKDLRVVFLGTGSAIPFHFRNVSCVLLTMPSGKEGTGPSKHLILDCGEGSHAQLFRQFGGAGSDDVLRDLGGVFISHSHADHCMGLAVLLYERQRVIGMDAARRNPLPIIGPRYLRTWLHRLSEVRQLFFVFHHGESLCAIPSFPTQKIAPTVLSHLGLTSIINAPVIHCKQAYGVALQHASGWKLVYSGDTRPCQSLVEIGRDADLLIHEATFDDTLGEEAELKKHSTNGEAVNIGIAMQARYIALTHISQRYSFPILDKSVTSHGRTCFAIDHMVLDLDSLKRAAPLMPRMQAHLHEAHGDAVEPRHWLDEDGPLVADAVLAP